MEPKTFTYSTGDDPAKASLYYGQDVIKTLRELPAGHFHTVATSPPYYALRDYELPPSVWGGYDTCHHVWNEDSFCTICGAWKGCLGLEPSPELYIEHLVAVFREVRRVLRDDGTLWLNLGDSFFKPVHRSLGVRSFFNRNGKKNDSRLDKMTSALSLKEKDLIAIPWMAALALRADGWFLRSDIVWYKPNAFPDLASDRPNRSHEYIFMLTKTGDHYYYDDHAIREKTHACRTVWNVNTEPYKGSHLACWPSELVRRMIAAGSSSRGCCSSCGAPQFQRVEGWHPTCDCPPSGMSRCRVLDPFSGSATTGLVALNMRRDYVGIDLSAAYLELAEARLRQLPPPSGDEPDEDQGLFEVLESYAASAE
jgi:site-specific DNA-methyltransferase (cytosine-N4-specific)